MSLAWGGYKNGQIPLTALTAVGNGQYLRSDVARQLDLMLDDYVADTWNKRPIVNSGYRSLAGQQWMLDHPNGQLIAAVGFSTHGWAITPDLSDTGRHPITPFSAWLDEHAAAYGFKRTIATESWHYQGGFPATITAALDRTPITEQDDDMSRLVIHPDNSIALAGNDGTFVPLATMDEVASLRATGAVGDKSTDVQLSDDFIWRLRSGIAARKAGQSSSDPKTVAAALAPLVIPSIVAAVAKVSSLTAAQVKDVSLAAIREVFADAATN